MSPKSVVVTGSNRGIGLGLIHQFLKNPDIKHIIATARDVDKATELASINDPRLHILPLVLNCDESIDNFVAEVTGIVGDDGLNLLVNNAAVMSPYITKETPDRQRVRDLFDTNTISTVILTQKLLPLLLKCAHNHSSLPLSVDKCAIINIASERLGSIELNTSGSGEWKAMAYRMTKTAINQFTKTIAIDLKDDGILCCGVDPGWVKTDMSGNTGEYTVEESTAKLVEFMGKLEEQHTGGFYRNDFSVIPF